MLTAFIPDLDYFDKIEEPMAQFYAIAGLLMSLNGALELSWYDVFEKAADLPPEMAAQIFYEVKSDEARSGIADKAMRFRLQGKPKHAEWVALAKRMKGAEISQHRNLVGHNPAAIHIVAIFAPPVYPPDPTTMRKTPIRQEVSLRVRQDTVQVSAGKRKHAEADYKAIRKACGLLAVVVQDVHSFLGALTWAEANPMPDAT